MSPEEDAHARLESAIEDYLRDTGTPGLLLDWVLVAHKIVPTDTGGDDANTSVVRPMNQTDYRAMGLLEFARSVIDTQIQENLRDGDDT